MKINGLILAAGNSSRLGQAKQLLQYQSRSLLKHIENMIVPHVNLLYAVLGFRAEEFIRELDNSVVVINPDWARGMGSSFRVGMTKAKKDADAVLVTLCDQPKIPKEHYIALIDLAKQHPQNIIASAYNGIIGVPVIFPRILFKQLDTIEGEQGAQKIIKDNHDHVITIRCDHAACDIDNPNDLRWLD